MGQFLDSLRNYIENTPREEVLKAWDEIKYLDDIYDSIIDSDTKYIFINWDFTTGNEISYIEVCNSNESIIETHCLDFFRFENGYTDVIVRKSNGTQISRNALLNKQGRHTEKEIRTCHNIHKMLVAGAFEFV